jgi:hypothetical protein
MPDLPPDLARLRVLETWLQLQLDQVRAAIAAAERKERRPQQPPARPRPAGPVNPDPTHPRPDPSAPYRPPQPDPPGWHPPPPAQPPAADDVPWWLLEIGEPTLLHRPDCDRAPVDAAPMTRAQALEAARGGAKPCFTCSPQDTLRPA